MLAKCISLAVVSWPSCVKQQAILKRSVSAIALPSGILAMIRTAKQSAGRSPHLSAPELKLLLSDEGSSDQFDAASRHLDSCESCQSRLTILAGDPAWWNVAESYLETEIERRWQPDLSQSL